ncbi:VanZ family protein [Nocardia takedensis]|uniref:VanZ family protein n=1 Tax=Nocardia takedensis TaxID=259390 RepID=UPI003570F942
MRRSCAGSVEPIVGFAGPEETGGYASGRRARREPHPRTDRRQPTGLRRLGLLLPLRHPWFRRPHRVLAVAVTASIAVEITPYALAIGRRSSVDDVLLNAVGAYLFDLLADGLFGRQARVADPASPEERTIVRIV